MALEVSAHLDSGEYNSTSVEMGLTLNIGGQVELDQAADWNAQKMAYGRQVVMTVADRVIPQLAAQFGGERTAPVESHVRASSRLDNESGTDKVGDTVLSVREQIAGTFRIQGDRNMSVGELVFTARDLIAGAVTESVLFALEQRLEGKQASDKKWRIHREDGEIPDYSRTDAPEKTGRHQPVPTSTRRH
jgi:hypothetical protein